jgi:crossover junction endodeoxyribonuclease RuvC
MKLLKSAGIDLSTVATGLVVLQEAPAAAPTLLLEREINCKKGVVGAERNRRIVTEIMETIHEVKPDKIMVEGYSLNMRNASSVVPLVELGGLLRFMLMLDELFWFDPRATEVKKFATGKGTGDKAQVMMHVLKRWGHESKTHNTADAYVLACMGLAQQNRLKGVTKEMLGIVGKLELRCN